MAGYSGDKKSKSNGKKGEFQPNYTINDFE
jgi:hypothetical protein